MVLQMTSVFISQYSIAIWFSYFSRVCQINLRYIILKLSKTLVSSQTYAFRLFKCRD